jgi:hypothetical protein
MKTDFKKSKNLAGIEKSTRDDWSNIDELVDRIKTAIEEKDADSLPWLQLEVHTRSLIMLKMLDWKMWEIYSKFIK